MGYRLPTPLSGAAQAVITDADGAAPIALADRATAPNEPNLRYWFAVFLASDHFDALGFEPVAYMYFTRFGVLDYAGLHSEEQLMVFATAQARQPGQQPGNGSPDDDKRRRLIRRMAAALVAETPHAPLVRHLRFDAVYIELVEDDRLMGLSHHEGAW